MGLWAAGAFALRIGFAQPEVCPPITVESALASSRAAADWMARVQREDGTFLYEYDIDAGRQIPGYNVVRHAGVLMSLYQLAGDDPASGALATADRGFAWARGQLFEHGNWMALRDPDDRAVESGGTALLFDAVAQRRVSTGDTSFDPLLRQLATFLLAMTQPDGSVLLAWDVAAGRPDPVQRSMYATGQVLWAFALMHRFFPGEGWDAHAHRVATYLALHRDTVEKQKFPPWADQWAAYGLAEMAAWPPNANGRPHLTADQVAYARSLAERFGFLVRVDSRRTEARWDRMIHGPRARAAGLGTWVEALDSLWRLSRIDPRLADLEGPVAERAVCSAGMELDRQWTAERAARSKAPQIAEGAWFTDGLTRMDDQQHALSGILWSIPILRERGALQ